MKAVILIVAFVGILALLPLTDLTGNVARYPMPWPGIDALTLHGEITDAKGNQLPPGRLIAYTANGIQFGEGGATLIDYTLTLTYGWHEQPPVYTISYYNYGDLTEYYCTTIDLRNLASYPISDSTVYVNLNCQFDLTKPEPNWPIITRPMRQGDVWVV